MWLHGDPYPENALSVRTPRRGTVSGYVFADPEPFWGDPAYDLGVIMRGRWESLTAPDAPLQARAWCGLMAAESAVPADRIWDSACLELVSTGLCLTELGEVAAGAEYLPAAEALAGSPSR